MRRTEEPLTDMQVEKEIERLTKSDAVKLARQERRIKYRHRQQLLIRNLPITRVN